MKDTKERLLASGKKHFLKKGFKGAALRKISADVGFTFGAVYGYFASKEDMFYALTDETAQEIERILYRVFDKASQLPLGQQLHGGIACFMDAVPELVDFIFAHRDETKLLLTRAEGTKYENFVYNLRMKDAKNLEERYAAVKESGTVNHLPMRETVDLLIGSFFSASVEAIMQGKDRDEVIRCLKELAVVYQNGLKYLVENGAEAPMQ